MNPLMNLVLFFLGTALLFLGVRLWRHAVRGRRRGLRLARRTLLEDALKHVHNHEGDGGSTLESLAGILEISPSKAVALVERMGEMGLARFVDGRILLTEEGRRYAVDVIRAHRLWERHLADETGVDPVEWHQRAERKEHRLTRAQTDALAERLGHPRFDPHGDPIPTADGAIYDEEVAPLASLDAGDRALVAHVEDEPQVVYAQLVALGVCPGMEIRVEARGEHGFEIESDGRRFALSPMVAQNVSIRRIERDAPVEAATATLASLRAGESAVVVRLSPACRGLERRRLMDLGVVAGTSIALERRGLTGGLSAYRVRGTIIGLREEQARMIVVERERDAAASPGRAMEKQR